MYILGVVLIVLSLFSCPSLANPYVGAHGHVRSVNLDSRFGSSFFKGHIPQVGLYGGYFFNEIVGVELGYDFTIYSSNHKTIGQGDYFPGALNPLGAGQYETYDAYQYVDSANIGVISTIPMFYEDLFAFSVIGVSHTKVRASLYFMGSDLTESPDATTLFANCRDYSKEGFSPFIKVGLIHKIDDNASIRLYCDWKRLGLFNVKSMQFPHGQSELRYKDSIAVCIGASYGW
jgi:opacity protein-like surface antigen